MATTEVAVIRAPHRARPGGRGVLVAADLAGLRGPTHGTVELPIRLFWQPDRRFDLDEPGMLRWMYQTVLREANRPDDLFSHLDGATLIALWPDLHLPAGVRLAWEDQHEVLRAAAATAPAG